MNTLYRTTLKNGLKIVLQQDTSTPMAVVNVLYDVGARDENPTKTGFAHLFEHFMFEGSKNIESFDTPLELAGGESNAFTTNDLTNYYEIIPSQNIETALWLESDRMLSLAFDQESLDVQKRVVCEEFKEHYINKPYGNLWHELSALAYKVHPYKWPTIGLDLSHVENASMTEVKSFFETFYLPSNAILSVCGNFSFETILPLIEKWFGGIPSGSKLNRSLPIEPNQVESRYKTLVADVPSKSICKAYKMPGRKETSYFSLDLIRDVIAGCETSALHQNLVKDKKLLSSVSCYLSESLDEGLFVIEGKLLDGASFEEVDTLIQSSIDEAIQKVDEKQLQKLKNKFETYWRFSDTNMMNRAFNLAFYELLGDANLYFKDVEIYNSITLDQLINDAKIVFDKSQCNTIFYDKQQK
jgi:zinc protease